MAIEVISKIKPKGNRDFAIVDAEDVQMPDGSRLSDSTFAYPIAQGAAELEPEKYYVFGSVSSLSVTLAEVDDGKAREYCFEFDAAEGFEGLTITPAPKWATEQQVVPGKTHQVSILRGLAVMVCA